MKNMCVKNVHAYATTPNLNQTVSLLSQKNIERKEQRIEYTRVMEFPYDV